MFQTIHCRHVPMLKLLLENGADLYAINNVRKHGSVNYSVSIDTTKPSSSFTPYYTGWQHSLLPGLEWREHGYSQLRNDLCIQVSSTGLRGSSANLQHAGAYAIHINLSEHILVGVGKEDYPPAGLPACYSLFSSYSLFSGIGRCLY